MGEDKEEQQRNILLRLHDLEAAFPKDESGNPDYGSHKIFHKEQVSAQVNFEASRRRIIANIFSWAAIGVLTVIGSAVVQYFLLNVKR